MKQTPVTPVRHRVTAEGNSLTAAGSQRENNWTRQCLLSQGDSLFQTLSVTEIPDNQTLPAGCSENNHCHKHRNRNHLCLSDTSSSLSLSHSLHLDYAPSCGQFDTATGGNQPHPSAFGFYVFCCTSLIPSLRLRD